MTRIEIIVSFIPMIIGIFVSDDARKRGMSQLGWGLFVWLVLIVGLPSYFIFRKPLLSKQEK